MSMKNTFAAGQNKTCSWHLYEEFGTKGGLFLELRFPHSTNTIFLEKDILKNILPSLILLEQRNWALVGEEDVTDGQIEDFTNMLQRIGERKRTAQQLADLEGDAVPFASNPKYVNKYVMEDWQPEDEEES